MKKLFTLLFTTAILTANAQLAKKYILFEHFTQASCGPCASQNPAFQDNILKKNTGKIHHIAFHTSWPGVDPMNAQNPTEVASRVSYYNVTGVPNMRMLGNKFAGSPASITQEMIDAEIALGSPLKIEVSRNLSGSDITVDVKLKTVGTMPAGTFALHVALVEKTVAYATPPGTNGEKIFPNVFRKMLSASNGDTYTPAIKGDSVSKSYSFTLNPSWKVDSIYAIAYIQEVSTREVINSGSSLDPPSQITNAEISLSGNAAIAASNGTPGTFNMSTINNGSNNETFKIKLIKNAPGDWSATFLLDGNTYSDSASVSYNGNSTQNLSISVTPGATPFLSTYTLTMQSVDNPLTFTRIQTLYVISGVSDLIVANTAGRGDGNPGNAMDWNSVYTAGLGFANNTSFATTNNSAFIECGLSGALTGVKNVYYNVGWTFPAFTDQMALQLKSFMDNGGNLFISGQDIGWEVMDAASTSSPTVKSFYTNYLKAQYVTDGTSANSNLNANPQDNIFNNTPASTIINFYNFAQGFYPDEMRPLAGAEPIFFYNNNKAKIGGVKSYNPTSKSKLVYLGVGVEMLGSATVKNEIIKTAHDWFYSTDECTNTYISTTQSNAKCNGSADGSITVTLSNATAPFTYQWSNSSTSQTATGLTAGSYTVTVTDSKSCTREITATVGQPAVLNLSTNSTASSGSNGTATANPTGGTTPYSYNWTTTPVQTTKTATGLAAGTYTVIVTDGNGCTRSANATVNLVNGISETQKNVSLKAVPNPAKNYADLSVSLVNADVINLTVYNVIGEKAFEKTFDRTSDLNFRLNLETFKPGIYFIRLSASQETAFLKLIVE